jgi:hypothetical protein
VQYIGQERKLPAREEETTVTTTTTTTTIIIIIIIILKKSKYLANLFRHVRQSTSNSVKITRSTLIKLRMIELR